MVQLTNSFVFLTTMLGASLVAAQSSMSEEAWKTKLDKHNKDAECDVSFIPSPRAHCAPFCPTS